MLKNIIRNGKQLMNWMEDIDVFGLAAQLAYFFLLSLFPFLLFLLNLIGYFPIDEAMILQLVANYAPVEVYELIEVYAANILNVQNSGLLSIGIIGTLWAASNGVNAISRAINRAYRIKEERSFIIYRLFSIFMTVVMLLVIIIALLLPVFGQAIGEFIFSFLGFSDEFLNVWGTFRWVTSSIIFFIVLLFLYRFIPRKKVYFRHVAWGALFSTVFFQLVSWGFSFYVSNLGSYSTTYGSLGAVIILMIWFYLFGVIVILGGALNAFISDSIVKNEKKQL